MKNGQRNSKPRGVKFPCSRCERRFGSRMAVIAHGRWHSRWPNAMKKAAPTLQGTFAHRLEAILREAQTVAKPAPNPALREIVRLSAQLAALAKSVESAAR